MVTRNVSIIFNEAINCMNHYYTGMIDGNSFKEFQLVYTHDDEILTLNVKGYHNQFTLTSWSKFNREMYNELISMANTFDNKEQIPISFLNQ